MPETSKDTSPKVDTPSEASQGVSVAHVVMFSGGISSWATAKRVVAQYGAENTKLLFTDTKMEDEDLYRFLKEATEDVGAELVTLADGRTPWEVFFDERMLGNSRVDPCSKILKRQLARSWVEKHYKPSEVVLYLGLDGNEAHRLKRSRTYWDPYQVESPLVEAMIFREELFKELAESGIKEPRLYTMGFPHNNCGGFCIKAGQAHFRKLLETMPERYAYHENQEEAFREFIGRDVSILNDRSGGNNLSRKPLTLKEFRHRAAKPGEENDWGGCGCFAD